MGRFFYKHFGDEVPLHIEKEYNKLRRRELWLEEKEAEFRTYSVDFDEIAGALADPSTLPINEIAAEKEALFNARLDYLPVAKQRNLELERENAELRKANDILKDALGFFAKDRKK